MEPIIEVCHLSKKYHLGSYRPYDTLRDAITGIVKRNGEKRISKNEFWALRDVNFSVNEGEIIGIIGRNGAGKSTLLKVLSRITLPTSGKAILRGKVASLLEVGTGFNHELTGRENIYLNGSVLGMTRKEINSRFDEIVSFSEIEKFVDTPVKYYSSGMYMRLAFAVSAHLNTDILIVDEVLAVGDIQFQQKCLEKMDEVSKKTGKTVLLVSHNLVTVEALATKCLFLESGHTKGVEPTINAIEKYRYGKTRFSKAVFNVRSNVDGDVAIISASVNTSDGSLCDRFRTYEDVVITITWKNIKGVNVNPNIMLQNGYGVTVMVATDAPIDFDGSKKKGKGTYLSSFIIAKNLLNSGEYVVNVAINSAIPFVCLDNKEGVLRFSIWDPMDKNSIARGLFPNERHDAVLWPALKCDFKKLK